MNCRGWMHTLNWIIMRFTICILPHRHTIITSTKNRWNPPTRSTSSSWRKQTPSNQKHQRQLIEQKQNKGAKLNAQQSTCLWKLKCSNKKTTYLNALLYQHLMQHARPVFIHIISINKLEQDNIISLILPWNNVSKTSSQQIRIKLHDLPFLHWHVLQE